ncbi:sensor histidine kinase [Rubinisphaera margarita]|uniref:sensor histidine kinase n=1 Tax=Rubinisphaera margarita TaxID=2909586 RepID=UPI001EE7A942|nr:HAMP domain-containing sensor histidine kinase [Rubinisphaera margarita]MCG6156641.1 HAMP domain-containing histidine kinase [Rubinisphaera margarita]
MYAPNQSVSDEPSQNTPERVAALENQLAEMQKLMLQLEKMSTVGVLASSITHEFNNILTTVINYAKMGLRHRDDATRDKAFDKILAAGQRAAKITTGMLSYARHRADAREMHCLSHLVEDVLVLVEKDLQKHRVSLVKNYAEEAYADVNPNQLQQILLNLIINARQAMAEGGTLTITVDVDREGPWALVAVKDTGSGIPADQLPKIFDNFYTTKKADEHGQGGTGLGLAFCRQIIEAHRGRIRVDSRVGEGTSFTLKLPLGKANDFISNKAG